jgi:hypothetical protein
LNELKQNIVKVKPRENSGSSSSNRFDFQKNWTLCKILELHDQPDDYLVTLEFHDDVIVFDSSTNPDKISFYQVKTSKSSNWTINGLIKRKKGKDGSLLNSHLGKLYEHIENFEDSVASLNFVTNNKIKGKLTDGTKCEDTIGFCCNDLEKAELDKVIQSLKNEHSLNKLKDFSNITFFKLGELSIDKHSELTKVKLADYIEKNLPDVKYQISPLYKSIFDEIRKKSNVEHSITDFEELKKYKSVSRKDFDSYLESLKTSESIKELYNSVENRLNSEGAGFSIIKSFRKNSKLYEIKKMTYNDKALKNVEKEIKQAIKKIDSSLGIVASSVQILNMLDLNKLTNNDIDKELIQTIIFYQLYE